MTLPSASSSLHSPYQPYTSYSPRPRRRTSISISLATPRPYNPYNAPTRRRARTMPQYARSRDHSHPISSKPSTRTKKVVIGLLIVLFLFLIGTVVVLSTVSYYLAIPTWAYLTESEVAWRPEDVIRPLRDVPKSSRRHKRAEWTEVGVSSGGSSASADAWTASAVNDAAFTLSAAPSSSAAATWDELEEEMEALDASEEDSVAEAETDASDALAVSVETTPSPTSSATWGIDGAGSGGYWMEKDWDGRVRDTDSWERLYNVSNRAGERIPRLIHQTWKDDQLPEKWRKAWRECREGMPDYEYMLWTDDTSREFIATHYPAHLHMYDAYQYPIQRADSIRYFILHHFGGVYMDLDIGCRRRLDPLLQGDWDVILPLTKPVGISNDLMFSAKGSAFMDDTVHGLSAFNHRYLTNYPTVMFSTGPMFLSAQYAIFSSSHPLTTQHPRAEVRVLPKSLYGKNAPISDVPHSFFSHFYGSSWHADDAGFITFLGVWGKGLMWVGGAVILFGCVRLVWLKRVAAKGQQYQLLSILPTTRSNSPTGYDTPTSTSSAPLSPTSLDMSLHQALPSEIASYFKRAGNLILAAPAMLQGDRPHAHARAHENRRGRRRQGLLYFVPALFQPVPGRRSRTASEASQLPMRRTRRERERDLQRARESHKPDNLAPPPYETLHEGPTSGPSRPSSTSRFAPQTGAGGVPEGQGERYESFEKEVNMDEVDAFLNEADNEGSMSGSGSGGEEEWREKERARERRWR
ncbi:hypothetical protein I350_05637 [Cryptococcus amylolentus CBS 6273]|uniref:MIPC synthase n=1 Tax=Cryptococcus amylolentus CBS 6273 TaxID=1296118 RepID=A0A1E3JW06_9TREE|nr:hypothetical protein I350_05637 [Cryptococcus amylolentus CBS 6273]